MSMVSHAAGSRFIELIGGAMTSFYDWYADLPVASPQVFGDQTDVPESGDWWDASYLMMWGSNVPVTRTPDAHWMAEVRYRGTKVVTVSPDYADNTKFADEWMPCAAGHRRRDGDGDGSRHPVGVPRAATGPRSSSTTCSSTPTCRSWSSWRSATVRMCPGRTSPPPTSATTLRQWRMRRSNRCCSTGAPTPSRCRTGRSDSVTPTPVWASGTSISATWSPALTVAAHGDGETATVQLTRFDTTDGHGETLTRGVPVRRVGEHRVCTVFDLMLAQYGVHRPGLPGDWPTGYDDPAEPYTPAWQEPITGVSAAQAIRVAREFARNAEESGGRSMIIMGAGICQWFHGDATYRAILAMLILTGSMGRNGGGWAHYVGQEKCRPITGWATMAMATDWVAAAAADDRHRPTGTRTPTSGATTATGPTRCPPRWAAAGSPGSTPWTCSPRRWRWAGCRSSRSSTASAWTSPTRRAPPGRSPALCRRATGVRES